MMLSVSICLFNGEELLLPLLKQIRDVVDHISVVYQTLSYRHNCASPTLVALLRWLLRAHLVDEILEYRAPIEGGVPKVHEASKRSLGLDLARKARATHFLPLDVDEFYCAEDLDHAKSVMEREGSDVSVCRIQEYHARPIYQRTELARYLNSDLYVTCLCRVKPGNKFDVNRDFFCCVDPSRRMHSAAPLVFEPETIVMHHMSTVRRNKASLVSKFINRSSGTFIDFDHSARLADLVWGFDPQKNNRPEVRLVEDQFGIAPVQEIPSFT